MKDRIINFGRDALTGESRGVGPAVFRAATSLIEPFYSAAMTVRNIGYDRGWRRSFDLGRATVSVGNITTGGTGKTPVVRWLAEKLREAGHRPAVLMRGYGAGADGQSDELSLLDRGLNAGDAPVIPVMADPSRVDGAAAVLKANSQIDRFILDDGFQHRRARRDFDLVLVNATDPFGGEHVLPRGLLREPVTGLRRADAVLLTRVSLVPAGRLIEVENTIRNVAPEVPVFHADHVIADAQALLKGRRVTAVSGIGDPDSFERQLVSAGAEVADRARFGDHHRYTERDLTGIAGRATGTMRVTTEKDWVKLEPLIRPADRAEWMVMRVSVRFDSPENQGRLLSLIENLGNRTSDPRSGS